MSFQESRENEKKKLRGGAAAPSRATIVFLSSFTLGPVKRLRNKNYGEASGRAGEAGDRAGLINYLAGFKKRMLMLMFLQLLAILFFVLS